MQNAKYKRKAKRETQTQAQSVYKAKRETQNASAKCKAQGGVLFGFRTYACTRNCNCGRDYILQDEHRWVSEVLFKHHSTRLPPSFGMGVQTIHCRLGGARDSILRGRRREAVASRLERRRRGGVEHLSRRVAATQLPMSTLLERVQTATNAGPRAGSASENL